MCCGGTDTEFVHQEQNATKAVNRAEAEALTVLRESKPVTPHYLL